MNDGCLHTLVFLLVTCLIYFLGKDIGRGEAISEYRACRTLLTARDSASILAAKPACQRWTWPSK